MDPPGVGDRAERGVAVAQAGELRSARLESLRAIAALAVLEGHVYGSSVGYGSRAYDSWWHRTLLGGGFGVYLFFALTGYLLYLPFVREGFGGGRPVDVLRYARNRALRILPLYYAVAITYLAVFHQPANVWATFLLFGENFRASTVGQVDGPMWSLVVEILFYVLLPFLAAAVARVSRRSLARAAAVLSLLGGAGGVYRWVGYLHAPHPGPLVQYNLPANFYFFVPGMLLALAKVSAEARGNLRLPGLRGSGWTWLVGAAVCWALVFDHYNWDLLCGIGAALVVGACVLPRSASAPVRALELRPLAGLGIASYSLYLWHLPIVTAMAPVSVGGFLGHLALDSAICVSVAVLSYRLIEAPFLKLRRRWGDTASGSLIPAPAP